MMSLPDDGDAFAALATAQQSERSRVQARTASDEAPAPAAVRASASDEPEEPLERSVERRAPKPRAQRKQKAAESIQIVAYAEEALDRFIVSYQHRVRSDGTTYPPSKSAVVIWMLELARQQLMSTGLPAMPVELREEP